MSETAFNKGISDFREPMVTYALSLTKNNEDAQDLVQDALFKALKYKNNYVENQNLKGWLITILRNTFLNKYNRDKKRPIPNSMDNCDHLLTKVQDYNHGEMKMNVDVLTELLSSVDEKFQRPFDLRNKGFKYEEIATKLDIPIGTVKHRIHRCRNEMKQKVNLNFA
ncbi:MAG: RNA polymerase sigma factor (sigma-70 family) [Cyclobacteriaceae bacterium]|jgi:RNA polymerase sigma-70 factor (ECF subfamily)